MPFRDRNEAGKMLVPALKKYLKHKDTIVVGLARGGVVTAHALAEGLHLPLNVVVVRKIGAPNNEELAIGAITKSGEGIFNQHLMGLLGVSPDYIKQEVEKQKKIAEERLKRYRGNCPAISLKGKIVIVVDDGIATGASMQVAIKAIKKEGAAKIVLAVPVAAPDSLALFEKEVDEIVCLSKPHPFFAVGNHYEIFNQTSDEEIISLLNSTDKDRD